MPVEKYLIACKWVRAARLRQKVKVASDAAVQMGRCQEREHWQHQASPSDMGSTDMERPNRKSSGVGSSDSGNQGGTWADCCPIGKESPARREAWRRGWEYRRERGPGTPKMEVAAEMASGPGLLSKWLQGFAAADEHFTGPKSDPPRL